MSTRPSLTILLLSLAWPVFGQTLYDYASRTQGLDIFAYDGQSRTQVPGNPNTPGNVLSPAEYNGIEADDGSSHVFSVTQNARYAQMRFVIAIDEVETDVTGLDVTWKGRGVNNKWNRQDGARLYIWNYASGGYQLLQGSGDTSAVVTLSGSLSASLTDFIGGGAQDTVTLLVVTNDKRTGNQALRLETDYVKLEVTAGCSITHTVRDDFNSAAYSNNTGTVNWSGDWIENDDDGSPTSGHIRISGGELSLDDISDSTAHEVRIEREADLSGAQSATLSFDFHNTASVDSDDTVFLDISNNGGATWTELDTFVGAFTTTQSKSYDILPYAGTNTRLRFRIKDDRSGGGGACCYGGDSEFFMLDFVQIAYTTPCLTGADHFAIAHDGNGINCQVEPVTVTAHDATHGTYTTYSGTITLGTSTGHGDWSLVTGGGVLDNGLLDDGAATYAFAAADNGQVVLGLRDTYVESVDIGASEGAAFEDPTEDPLLSFAETGFNFLADGVADAIGTQIAGKSSGTAPGAQSLELQAIRTSDATGACEAALTGVNTVDLAFECLDPATCTAANVSINGSPVAGNDSGSVVSYTGLGLDFGDATDSTAPIGLVYPDAGRLRLHARYAIPLASGAPSGNLMQGASNAFVVRPLGFDIDFSNDRQNNGTGGPSYAAGPGGSIFVKAGQSFSATVTAVMWQAADDADNDGVPDAGADLTDNGVTANFGQEATPAVVDVTHALTRPPGPAGDAGTLGGGTGLSGFGSGALTVPLNWSEVGIIDLSASLNGGDYLGSGQDITGGVLNVGRFYPDHFNVALSTADATNTPTFDAGCASFTYLDQPLNYTASAEPILTITARNTAGMVTQNYYDFGGGEDWWNLADLPLTYTDAGLPAGVTIDTSAATTSLASSSPTAKGTYSEKLTGPLAYQRPGGTLNAAPFNAALRIDLDVKEPPGADGVAYDDGTGSSMFGFDVGFAVGQGSELRHGRLNIRSASGSERLALGLPLFSEYFNGAGFVANLQDGCTGLALATHLALSNPQTGAPPGTPQLGSAVMNVGGGSTQASLGGATFISGDAGLAFSAPGAGNTGYVDIDVDISSVLGTPYWLQYNWSGGAATHTENPPPARATFGIFQGSSNLIQIREPWN